MRADSRLLAAVFAGGFAGALARTELAIAWPADGAAWPWATFTANVGGALLLGLIVGRDRRAARAPGTTQALLGAGFCGALTTFSALQLELLTMLSDGRIARAAVYAFASVAAGLAGIAATSRTPGERATA